MIYLLSTIINYLYCTCNTCTFEIQPTHKTYIMYSFFENFRCTFFWLTWRYRSRKTYLRRGLLFWINYYSTEVPNCYLVGFKKVNASHFNWFDGTPAEPELIFPWIPGDPQRSFFTFDCACFKDIHPSIHEYRLLSISCKTRVRVICTRSK